MNLAKFLRTPFLKGHLRRLFFYAVKPLKSGHLRVWPIVRYLEVSAFLRFAQNSQFLSFLPFSFLYEDMQTFPNKKCEEVGYI